MTTEIMKAETRIVCGTSGKIQASPVRTMETNAIISEL